MSCFTSKLALFTVLVFLAVPLHAKKEAKKADVPFYRGINLGVEVGGSAMSLFSDNWSGSAKLDLNIKNAYLPTLEIGQARYNQTGATGIRYTSSGPFFKLGLNLPIVSHGPKAEDLFYVGLHYGLSPFSFQLAQLSYSGGYWGNPSQTTIDDQHGLAGWADAVAGVRVKVLGPVSLGWSLHYRNLIHVSNGTNGVPAYIPGYGQHVKPNAAINAHIYYRF
jgi:hypothetical protein